MSALLISAMAWCDGFTLPLAVPLNGWLQPPLPPVAHTLAAPGVHLVEWIPSGQHVVCVADHEPQLWHVMSGQLVHSFAGHTGRVRCLAVTRPPHQAAGHNHLLVTGADDHAIIAWDLGTLNVHMRVCEHRAPVLCVTVALANTVIVSGGEDCNIVVTSLANGKVT